MAIGATRLSAVAVLAVLAAAGNYLRAGAGVTAPAIQFDDVSIGDLAYEDEALSADFLDVLRADATLFRTYRDQASGAPVWVFLGYFPYQREGSQVHSPQHCYPGSGWAILSETSGDALLPGAGALVVGNARERRFVAYWYQMGEAATSNVFDLKLRLTKNAIARRSQAVVFARVSTVIDGGVEEAAARIGPMVAALHGDIAERMEKAQDRERR